MKNFLVTLFFLGLTTTGFAQLVDTKTYEGRSAVNTRTPGVISLSCSPADRICFSVTQYRHHSFVRLMVPDHGINVIATPMGTVNGVPFENLPPNNDDEDQSVTRDYIITYEEIKEEI